MTKIILFFVICISILKHHILMITGESKSFECLYDECLCVNETNININQISVICLARNSMRNSSEYLDTNLQSFNIKTFQFYNYNLKSLPENIFVNLTIQYLALDLKEVETLSKKSLHSIKLLTHLAIYHLNKFEKNFLPSHINDNLTSLTIELSNISSIDLIRKEINLCRNLRQLSLSHNRLIDFVSSKILADMKNIETLKLNNNQIEIVLFDNEIHSLKHLDLSNNKLKFIQENTFKYLKNLILLDLFQNEIKFIESNTFFHVKSLLYLYLGNNYVMKLPSFECLSRLRQLDIQNQRGFLMNIPNNSFNFETTNKNKLNVYLDEYFLKQNLTYDWYLNANRPIQFEMFNFDLTLKNLETLFRNHLSKAERFQNKSSDNKNYIVYRLLSQQISSVFDLNYFANNYQIDYDFEIESNIFTIGDQLDCIITFFKSELVKKTKLNCGKKMKKLVLIKSQPLKVINERNVSKNLKLKINNSNSISKSSAIKLNLEMQQILYMIIYIFFYFS